MLSPAGAAGVRRVDGEGTVAGGRGAVGTTGVRAAAAIQSTIQVTDPTARIDRDPPMLSCAWNDSPRGP